jgi:DNA-binding response OmpR family regulator
MTHNRPPHILVVDDDPQIRLLLRNCFELEGYGVTEASSGDDVRACLGEREIDLITLDLKLDGEDGLAIARELRATTSVPIVMITGKNDTIDTVLGLEMGADDYIAKPFHVREVLARVRSVLRRAEGSVRPQSDVAASPNADRFRFGGWTIDLSRLELRDTDGSVCDLTTGEFKLLEIFVRHANRVLSRDQLMDLLKGHDYSPFDRSIDNQVARLRKKIEPDASTPKLIKTVRGIGYSLTADVIRC